MKRMLLAYCILNLMCLLSIIQRFILENSRVIEQIQNVLRGFEVRSVPEVKFNEVEALKSEIFSSAINQ